MESVQGGEETFFIESSLRTNDKGMYAFFVTMLVLAGRAAILQW